MNWLDKTPTELFKTIPQDILDTIVVNKQQENILMLQDLNSSKESNFPKNSNLPKDFNLPQELKLIEDVNISKTLLVNQLMTRHILSKHNLPHFILNQENLIRWLFCMYIIE